VSKAALTSKSASNIVIIYTSGLYTPLAETGAQGQLYADEIQAYIHYRPANATFAVGEMVVKSSYSCPQFCRFQA